VGERRDFKFDVQNDHIIDTEREITSRHIHWKSCNISETVLEKVVLKTGH